MALREFLSHGKQKQTERFLNRETKPEPLSIRTSQASRQHQALKRRLSPRCGVSSQRPAPLKRLLKNASIPSCGHTRRCEDSDEECNQIRDVSAA